jgi:DNA polymerase II small subunit/DNA polymerase delta subunit B
MPASHKTLDHIAAQPAPIDTATTSQPQTTTLKLAVKSLLPNHKTRLVINPTFCRLMDRKQVFIPPAGP